MRKIWLTLLMWPLIALPISARGAGQALAIRMPDEFDDAYQVYVNGRYIGEFGGFTRRGVGYYDEQPAAFSLPADLLAGPVTIAIRMWMDPVTALLIVMGDVSGKGLKAAMTVRRAAQNFGQEDDISVLSVTRIETMKAELA
jgi:hypothetical protein